MSAKSTAKPVGARKARTLKRGIIKAGMDVDAPPPRLGGQHGEAGWWRDRADEEVEDGAPVLICPSCFEVYHDQPTAPVAICAECERTLRRYVCDRNPEADEAAKAGERRMEDV